MTAVRFIAVALVALAATPAYASWLSGSAAADRESAAPLRALDLRAVVDGAAPAVDPAVALAELPSRCQAADALERDDCDDVLRCGWLAARARFVSAWVARKPLEERAATVHELDRAALRLAAGGSCGGKDEAASRAWQMDRAQSAEDAAVGALALWVIAAKAAPPGAVEWPESDAARAAVRQAARSGAGSVDPSSVAGVRRDIARASGRMLWLTGHPTIARVREIASKAWEPWGGVPRGCGARLWQVQLIEDGWRGLLVREVVPETLACLSQRLPGALEREGLAFGKPSEVNRLVEHLAATAAVDSGGRQFPGSVDVMRELNALERALEPVPASRKPPARVAQKKAPVVAKRPASREPAKKPAARPKERGARSQATRPARKSARANPQLVDLARRVEALGPGLADENLLAQARRATDGRSQAQALNALIVAAHRRLCGPLETLSLEDLEASRALLAKRGAGPDENACRGLGDAASAERLLEAAPGLQRLTAAAAIRDAARSVATGRVEAAASRLEQVPAELRGTTWSLVRAWAFRRGGDPVSASEIIAALDESTLDRLRASGDDAVAQLVAHATVTRTP